MTVTEHVDTEHVDTEHVDAEHVDSGTDAVWPDLPAGHEQHGPLRGLKVLDLTAYAVGPWAACNLAQLGADVVRVDPPYGDPIRAVLPQKQGEPTTYMSCTLGKRSIVLNLKDESDHKTVLRLAASADVVLENSRAGAMERLGLGYASLRALNPRLIYCSSSSFGDLGPLSGMGSTDPQGQAFSGFASTNGAVSGDPEVLRYVALIDLATSMQLLNAVLISLVARRRTGRGQFVRTSQMEAAIGIQVTRFAEFFATGQPGRPGGSGTPSLVPSAAFKCSDGAWISVTAQSDSAWKSLCTAVDPVLLDRVSQLRTNAQRVEERLLVEKTLAQAFSLKPSAWWTQILPRVGVACVRFRTLEDKPEQTQHFIRNELIDRVPHPVSGTVAVAGPVWKFEKTPARLGVPVLPGRDTAQIREQIGARA